MSEIYRRNSRLIVWLGEPDVGEVGRSQITELEEIHASTPIQRTLNAVRAQTVKEQLLGKFLGTAKDTSREQARAVMSSIISRAWFQRRWVVQELAFPPQEASYLLLGNVPCEISLFKERQSELGLLNASSPLWRHGTSVAVGKTTASIFSILYHYDAAQCFDARDRVYALVSVCGDRIPVDYNLDHCQVYLGLVKRIAFDIEDDFHRQVSRPHQPSDILIKANEPRWTELPRVLALASCKKTASREEALEAWIPNWTTKTSFESEHHKSAVERCLSPDWDASCSDFAAIFETANGHCFCVLKGLTIEHNLAYRASSRSSSRTFVSITRLSQMLQRFWPVEALSSDCIWVLPLKAGSEPSGLVSTWRDRKERWRWHQNGQVVAFVLRAGATFDSIPSRYAYRLHSCFLLSRSILFELVTLLRLVANTELRNKIVGLNVDAEIYLE